MSDDSLLSLSRVKGAISLCVHCCRGGATEVAYHRLLQWRESIRAAEAEHAKAEDRVSKLKAALALAAERLDAADLVQRLSSVKPQSRDLAIASKALAELQAEVKSDPVTKL